MITQGRISKSVEASSPRKYKQREENFTLGNVVQRLNLATEKKVMNNTAKKAAILETLHHASTTHDVVSSAKDPHELIFEMKSMRKSLQTQLKNDGLRTPCSDARRQLSPRKQVGGERGYTATSLGRKSNASSQFGVVVKRNETEKKYHRKESQGRLSTTKQQMPARQHEYNSVYSRHLTTVTPRITLEENSPIETPTRLSDIDNKSDLDNGNEDALLSASDAGNNAALSETKQPSPDDMSLKEEEVLNRLTDPQLKESLQNIIKRRRSSVRFVKSDLGYDMVNLEKTINEQLEETSAQHQHEQQLAESESAIEAAESSDDRSVKSTTSRRVSENRERLTSAGTTTSESCHTAAVPSRQPRTRSRKLARQEQRIPMSARRVSSARSCASTASNLTQRSLSSPILRRRKPELQTEETRVIRPATAKGYVPNLTNRKISRKQSAVSCPDISQDQVKSLAQVNMIREFLLMYAKVATKKDEGLPGRKPVRMMSQTPELVIKSAIGQFLTRAFPSGEMEEWTGLSAQSKKERYEEQQRSKLLRIKICMKHLASVA